MQQSYVGVDISIDKLDIAGLEDVPHTIIPNNKREIGKLIASLEGRFVMIEATSIGDRILREELTKAKIPFHRANPHRARSFAKGAGFLAKTDKVDAFMLKKYGEALEPKATIEASKARRKLAWYAKRREQLVEERKREKTRLKQAPCSEIRKDINSLIDVLNRRIKKFDKLIGELIEGEDELREDARRLKTVPGVGPVTATALLSSLAELGTLDRRAVSALAGLAPLACDSGKYRGKRKIWGGRRKVRKALYMAARSAVACDNNFAAFHRRMLKNGLEYKQSIIAAARKLLVVLNAMLRDEKDYGKQVIAA